MADLDLRIDQLPLGTPGPNDPIPFRDLVSGVTKKFLAGLVLPSPTTTDIEWDPDAAAAGDYDDNEIVTYGGNIYQSEINNNPSVPGTNADWTLLTRGSGGISFWEAGVFLEDELIKAYDLPGVGPRFFRLDPAEPRPFNSTDFETELAADTWIRMYNENFWPLSGSANLSGAVTITASTGEHIDLLGSSPRFNVQRDGNRSIQFQIDSENGAFGSGGIDMPILDPGTNEGIALKMDDIFFEVSSTVNSNNHLRFRGDSTPEAYARLEDGFILFSEKDITNNITYLFRMDNSNYINLRAIGSTEETFFQMLTDTINIQSINTGSGQSTNIVVGDTEFSIQKVDSVGGTSTEISTDGLDINLSPDSTGFLNLGISPAASLLFTQSHRAVIKFNGTSYYVPLQAV